MDDRWDDLISCPVLHSGLEVRRELSPLLGSDVDPSGDRALPDVERYLALLGAAYGEPGRDVGRVRSGDGEGEGVRERDEDPLGARRRCPADIHALGHEPAHGPVAHDVHRAFALGEILQAGVPGVGRVVDVHVVEQPLEDLKGLGDAAIGPGDLTGPQATVFLGLARPSQDVLEEVGGLPSTGVAQHEWDDPLPLQEVGEFEELLPGGRRCEPILLEDGLAIPKDVGAVDVDRDAPVVALIPHEIEQCLGEHLLPAFHGV